MNPRRVLIAGCGDVGTRAGLLLAGVGAAVFGLRRSVGALPADIAPVALDLGCEIPAGHLPSAIDSLVYCAAPDARDEASYREIFLHGPRRLLAALDAPPARIVFVSSTAVYAQDDGEWVDESSPAQATSFNGRVLIEAERALLGRSARLVVLRLSGLYGPGRERARRRALAGERGDARWSNRLHVDDAAAAIAHLVTHEDPAPLYLGSDPEPLREDALFASIRAGAGLPPLPAIGSEASTAIRGRRIDGRALRQSRLAAAVPPS
jgi:nucleoside-diphosphate-sugar epimerase